jgi:16S rRNA (cytosine1402-N4)-methyltransferase
MLIEVIGMLNVKADMDCIDMTVGAGGHAEALLEATAPSGRLLGIDRDAAALDLARRRLARFGSRAVLAHGSYAHARAHAEKEGIRQAHAVLFDLGVSSMQLDEGGRGFSFRVEAPLDMRMDCHTGVTAEDVVNTWPEEDIARVLQENSDEPLARGIARAICRRRCQARIGTTTQLAGIVAGVYCRRGWRHSRVHPATRTFQALRMVVNNERDEIKEGLAAGLGLLTGGGRMAVISFHSGEDRVAKVFFKEHKEKEEGTPVTKKPLEPSREECSANPRARSAKLRVFEKMGEAA